MRIVRTIEFVCQGPTDQEVNGDVPLLDMVWLAFAEAEPVLFRNGGGDMLP